MQIYNVVRKDGVVSLRSVKPARASPVEIFQYVLPLPLNMPSQSRALSCTLLHSAPYWSLNIVTILRNVGSDADSGSPLLL